MMEPSEILREEHVVIEHLLAALDGIAEHLDRGEAAPREDLDAALEVVVNFADKCHHAKEEKVLFPALMKHSADEGGLLVRRLHGDHEAARKLVRGLRDAIPSVAAHDPKMTKEFARLARVYTSLLREHIAAETDRLLPLMDRTIPGEEKEALAREFDRVEREEMGTGVHERYGHLVHRLADRYAA
ncbi:MAG TPA: hemerythrin domain-containing protein [Thermoplasmata archaeon]